MKNRFNIAVIAGDGIGKEVMPEGIKVLKKVSEKFDINLKKKIILKILNRNNLVYSKYFFRFKNI